MGIRIACRQNAARTSLRSLLVVPFIILAAACSENATEPVQQLDASPSLSLADAQLSGTAGPIASKLGSGMCMAYDSNGAIVNSCDGSSRQNFTFKSNGSIVANNGACVAVDSDSYAARIKLSECDGSAGQKWTATKAGELRGIGGKCVGVAWNRPTNGTKLVLWTCNGTDSQKWDVASGAVSDDAAPAGSLSISSLKAASGKSYKVVYGGTKASAVTYIDRSYKLASPIPAEINGATYIQTANDDKFASLGSTSFLTFDVNTDVDVYVAYDNDRDLIKPSWLTNGFQNTGKKVISSYNDLNYTLYKKSFAKGKVTLGSTTTKATDGSMYLVFIVPKGGVSTPPPADTGSSDPSDGGTTEPGDGGSTTPPPSGGSSKPTSGIFVSPSGSSSASGSLSSPISLSAALSGAGGKVSSGDTVWVRAGTYSGKFSTSLSASSSAPIIIRAYPGERANINGTLTVSGSNVWFWGLEVSNTNGGERETPGVTSTCSGCRFINMLIHDHSSNGLQVWDPGSNQEAYGNIIYNNGFSGQSVDHAAHGIYAQNRTGTMKIVDNLFFNQFGYGVHVYGSENAALNNFTIQGNTVVNSSIGDQTGMSGGMEYQVGGGAPLVNLVFTQNNSYQSPSNRGHHSARIGMSGGANNSGGTITNSYLVGPWIVSNFSGATMSNNTVIDGSMPTSTKVIVQPNKYEAGRANVVIYNWGRQGAVSVDLSKVLKSGDSYEVRNAQNFYASPVASGTYNGGSISLPITNAAPAPTISSRGKAVSTGAEFNAYVIVKK